MYDYLGAQVDTEIEFYTRLTKRNYFTYGYFAGVISAGFIATLIILLR